MSSVETQEGNDVLERVVTKKPHTRKIRISIFNNVNGIDSKDMLPSFPHELFDAQIINIETDGAGGWMIGDYKHTEQLYENLLNFGGEKGVKSDAIFTINRGIFSGASPLLWFCQTHDIAVCSWMVDDPGYILMPKDEEGRDGIFYFHYDPLITEAMNKQGHSTTHLPLGTNILRFKPPTPSDAPRPFKVSFVGTLGTTWIRLAQRGIADDAKKDWDAQRCMHTAREGADWLVENPGVSPHGFLSSEDKEAAGGRLSGHIAALIDLYSTANRRIAAAVSLCEMGVQVFGESEWMSFVPFENYRGFCPRARIHEVYQRSDVVVNVSRHQFPQSYNHRFFDVNACGADLVTEDQPMDPLADDIRFHSFGRPTDGKSPLNTNDLQSTVRRALQHRPGGLMEDQGAVARERQQKLILSRHTYKQRWERIHEVLMEKLVLD